MLKLYTQTRAPNPRRVEMFLAEKNVPYEPVQIDLMGMEHRSAAFLAINPIAKIPVLELEDGRFLSETRAICTYIEGLYPEVNLMGTDAQERAWIEMADRRAEFQLLLPIAHWIRHTHPALGVLEQPQFADFGQAQGDKLAAIAQQFDTLLQGQPWMAGERFTIADITAFCALEFARGLKKFVPAKIGCDALQDWRERIAARPSAARR